MSTIADTVTQAMRDNGLGAHLDKVGPVVAVLEQREAGIVSKVTAYAAKKGADMDVVERFVAKQGLATPAAEVADDDLAGRLSALERTVQRALDFARSKGFRG